MRKGYGVNRSADANRAASGEISAHTLNHSII